MPGALRHRRIRGPNEVSLGRGEVVSTKRARAPAFDRAPPSQDDSAWLTSRTPIGAAPGLDSNQQPSQVNSRMLCQLSYRERGSSSRMIAILRSELPSPIRRRTSAAASSSGIFSATRAARPRRGSRAVAAGAPMSPRGRPRPTVGGDDALGDAGGAPLRSPRRSPRMRRRRPAPRGQGRSPRPRRRQDHGAKATVELAVEVILRDLPEGFFKAGKAIQAASTSRSSRSWRP